MYHSQVEMYWRLCAVRMVGVWCLRLHSHHQLINYTAPYAVKMALVVVPIALSTAPRQQVELATTLQSTPCNAAVPALLVRAVQLLQMEWPDTVHLSRY